MDLGDQDRKVLVVVLSHTPGAPADAVPNDVAALETVDAAGTDCGPDGRRVRSSEDRPGSGCRAFGGAGAGHGGHPAGKEAL
ncbi:hypothetical protein LG634_06550 [Streptomyces bambusae]|uniref:hypothetical protein n=1 Tax=Streptomyces bambusae TaxID=1550616 RepID=UPI001CFE8950|nr:hypothetical protein [Streptomyces bambusae]MCB5164495.1 hypothetical protein [Streptomyces bambusae]